jgi:uncharacterized protein YutE (UPF0331/DUF86 family)
MISMKPEFSGIERRLEKIRTCLKKLENYQTKKKNEILKDPLMQDIIERNLEVSAQAAIDIANRIISIEDLEKPRDYYEAILQLGKADVIPLNFAEKLAPIAGFRNILVHDYLDIDWDEVYNNLHKLHDLSQFMDHVKNWMKSRNIDENTAS